MGEREVSFFLAGSTGETVPSPLIPPCFRIHLKHESFQTTTAAFGKYLENIEDI